MSLRTAWKFAYPCKMLVGAAKKKLKHHEDRKKFWDKEHAIALQDAKDNGIEVKEEKMSGGNRRGEIAINYTFQHRLTECFEKVHDHTKMIEEFTMWERVFELNKEAIVELDAIDITYFGL